VTQYGFNEDFRGFHGDDLFSNKLTGSGFHC